MSKNILELCLSPDLGGLELSVVKCFDYFKISTPTYICVAPHKKLDARVEDEKKFLLKRSKLFPFVPAFKLAKFIDEKEIDIIHFHWTKDIATAVLAKVLSKRSPKIVQSRHMGMTRFKSDFYHKWLYENISTIHAVTQQVKEQLQKYIPQSVRPKVEMVYLGVDLPIVDAQKVSELSKLYALEGSFVVGIVGRIEEAKGQYLLIEALSKLKQENIKALIIGATMDEEYLTELKAMSAAFHLQQRVVFTGFTKDVNEHLALCDVSVLATPKETFGLVVIESMANEVPVIATNRGGPLEIIDDKVDGLLFERTSDDLADKIEMLYESENLREEIAKNALKKVEEKFYKEKQMKRMCEVISES